MSFLADTGDALEANRKELAKTNDESGRVNLMATISQHHYESLPKRMTHHLYQWMDCVASIKSLKTGVDEDSITWDLVVKTNPVFDSIGVENSNGTSHPFKINHYYDGHHELCQEIVWNA